MPTTCEKPWCCLRVDMPTWWAAQLLEPRAPGCGWRHPCSWTARLSCDERHGIIAATTIAWRRELAFNPRRPRDTQPFVCETRRRRRTRTRPSGTRTSEGVALIRSAFTNVPAFVYMPVIS
jgi:hypothetical protein